MLKHATSNMLNMLETYYNMLAMC